MSQPTDKWYSEPILPTLLHQVRLVGVRYAGKTAYQSVEIVETDPMGLTLVLNGTTQSAQMDEFIYHEALVHPALVACPEPRSVLIAGGGEGATLREVLRHNTVQRATMVDLDGELVDICRQHLPTWHQGAFDDSRATVVYADVLKY
ncbi:MAG: spermidine synthase, partial [Dehalococcoidia bacterium]|nr:spermidine synthase [Dehalococcoidia bacterium]